MHGSIHSGPRLYISVVSRCLIVFLFSVLVPFDSIIVNRHHHYDESSRMNRSRLVTDE
jgi:hypothetical protein